MVLIMQENLLIAKESCGTLSDKDQAATAKHPPFTNDL